MLVRVSRIDKELPLPEYHSQGAVAFDLIVRETAVVPSFQVALLPVNVVVAVPPGYALLLSSRSSTARKKGLIVPLGIIDQDFHGPADELKLQVINMTTGPVTIERGERVGQALFVKIERAVWREEAPEGANRGGFGTTGGYAG